MWIGCVVRGAAWRRPTGGAWERAKAGAGMIGSGTNPNRPRTCGSMSLTAKREASYKPAPWKCWPPVRCLPPPCKRIGWRKGWGNIGEEPSRGLFLHSLQAFRLDGIPLGTAWAEVWARPPETDTAKRNEQSVDEKESGRWIRALQAASQRARQMPQTQLLVCGDRESDIYELYDQLQGAPGNLHVLVRGQHDRCLSDGTRLVASLRAAPLGGILKV